jgi:hypothetical protein
MKKLITILLIITLSSCEKEDLVIYEDYEMYQEEVIDSTETTGVYIIQIMEN